MTGEKPVPGYVLQKRLGRGGFGEVWQAQAPGEIPIAMKFIALGSQAGALELRALEAVKAIRHPHLVSHFGAWQLHGYLILAMELADSSLMDELKQAVKQGQPGIPCPVLLEYMRDAAEGLDHLKEVKLLHRDVKPQNLLIVGKRVKVGDFGLLKVLEEQSAASGSMTPMYAAPEMFDHRVSEHSDQYSLAITYCQLRGNTLPFQGTTPTRLMHAHLMEEPDLSMLTDAERPVILRALAKQPDQRWPHCTAWVQALKAALGLESPQPPPLQPVHIIIPQDTTLCHPPAPVDSAPKAPLPPPPPGAPRQPRNWRKRFRRMAWSTLIVLLMVGTGLMKWWPELSGEVQYNSVGMKLVRLPGGTLEMGSPPTEPDRESEETPHTVEITRPFLLGVTEVTQEQYVLVMGTNPAHFQEGAEAPKRPVESVTWDEAVAFCQKLSARPEEKGRKYRLPTEAEWEYACRGGKKTATHFGAGLTAYNANFDGNYPYYSTKTGPYQLQPLPVGSFKANTFGLCDMHGNVAEWCQDWYSQAFYAQCKPPDPLNEDSSSGLRVVRGGGWDSLGHQCRAAARRGYPPTQRYKHIGFRVVCELSP
jgi:formylglycine-generating enzyme required for sulfatase activity